VSEPNGNGVMLKWAHLVLIICVQLVASGATFGVLKFEVEDHARRLADIERKQDANFISREEYDKRHDDLLRQVQELRQELRELERTRR
jgi:hypothetical protein